MRGFFLYPKIVSQATFSEAIIFSIVNFQFGFADMRFSCNNFQLEILDYNGDKKHILPLLQRYYLCASHKIGLVYTLIERLHKY